MTTISSLSEFVVWAVEQQASASLSGEDTALFYRGHSDCSWQLQPSVYRKDSDGRSYRENEYALYQEMLRRTPDAFEKDTSVFERLVRMQHHGLPTRLLDLTTSPLIALFFACENAGEGLDGEVLLFKTPRSSVAYPHAIPEASLIGIEQKLQLMHLGPWFFEQLSQFFSLTEKNLSVNNDIYLIEYRNLILRYQDIISSIKESKHPDDILTFSCALNNIDNMVRQFFIDASEISFDKNDISTLQARTVTLELEGQYYQYIKNSVEKISREINMKYDRHISIANFVSQFTTFNFVNPPLNNERLRRQHGLFLIFPPMESRLWPLNKYIQPIKIGVNSTAKATILHELASSGITRSHLFPGLEEQARDIKSIFHPS